jgi:hypothetical protein
MLIPPIAFPPVLAMVRVWLPVLVSAGAPAIAPVPAKV